MIADSSTASAEGNPGDLGRRLVERRHQMQLERDVVADEAGIDPHYLAYLEEQPGAQCSQNSLRHLARALETTPAQLLGVGFGQALGAGAPPGGTSQTEVLGVEECRSYLRRGGIGRLVFVDGDRPVALPVNFRLLGDDIVFRTGAGSIYAAVSQAKPLSLAVDRLDEALGEGWSVVASGCASTVLDAGELERIEALAIKPWASGVRPRVVRLVLDSVTGRRILRRL
jgi:nitroimidazol reductase NimA-like FMN-containing flavoprotein (pyridoxamine 5'-phosphate oxidase superfamily)